MVDWYFRGMFVWELFCFFTDFRRFDDYFFMFFLWIVERILFPVKGNSAVFFATLVGVLTNFYRGFRNFLQVKVFLSFNDHFLGRIRSFIMCQI